MTIFEYSYPPKSRQNVKVSTLGYTMLNVTGYITTWNVLVVNVKQSSFECEVWKQREKMKIHKIIVLKYLDADWETIFSSIWATSRENLSSGFATS